MRISSAVSSCAESTDLISVYNSDVRDGGINAEKIFGCTGTGL